MENKLTSAKSIRSFLDETIRDSLDNVRRTKLHQKSLEEKDKQSLASAAGAPAPDEEQDPFADSGDGGGEEDMGGEQQPEEQPPEDDENQSDSEALAQGEVGPEDVIDKLNTIRSGKSFKDSAIESAMEEYVNNLEEAEKTALLAFLKGIAQIVTGEITGDTAVEPADDPSSVQMQKSQSPQSGSGKKKTIKPNVIRGSSTPAPAKQSVPGAKPKQSGAEDTSGPTPIVPKRRG